MPIELQIAWMAIGALFLCYVDRSWIWIPIVLFTYTFGL